jgi:exoribonuclease-2
MRARGLLPVFAPQALQEAEAARRTSPERNGTTRDLRHLTWFSIDNDDTRYLDQLSVAEPLAAGSTRLLVAVADVDAMVRPRRRGGYASGWWRWMQKKASSTSNTLELRSQKFA